MILVSWFKKYKVAASAETSFIKFVLYFVYLSCMCVFFCGQNYTLRIKLFVQTIKYTILIRSNEMQQYAGVYLLQNPLHVSGVYRIHHQEYIKL